MVWDQISRWWNYINDDGESTWVFESRPKEDQHRLSTTEVPEWAPASSSDWILQVSIFWAGLVAAPAFWVLFFFTAIFSLKLKWLVLVVSIFLVLVNVDKFFFNFEIKYIQVIGLSLSVSNLLGYLRCRLGRTESTSALISGVANQYLQVRRVFLLLTLKAGWTIALWELLNELFCRSKWWTGWWGSSVQLPEMETLELPWGSSACNTFNFQTVMWYLISCVTYLITSFTR